MAAQSPPNLFMWWTIKNQPAKTLSRWLDIFTADWLWQQESQTQPSLSFIQPGRLIIRFLNILQLVRCTGAAGEINVHLDNNKLNIIESEHCLTQCSCPSQSPLSESADQVEAGAMPWRGWEVERLRGGTRHTWELSSPSCQAGGEGRLTLYSFLPLIDPN